MERIRPEDPFILEFQEHVNFGIEGYSYETKEEALEGAIAEYFGGNPDWVRVIDRKGNIIYTPEETLAAWEAYRDKMGIKEFTCGIQTSFAGGVITNTVKRLS